MLKKRTNLLTSSLKLKLIIPLKLMFPESSFLSPFWILGQSSKFRKHTCKLLLLTERWCWWWIFCKKKCKSLQHLLITFLLDLQRFRMKFLLQKSLKLFMIFFEPTRWFPIVHGTLQKKQNHIETIEPVFLKISSGK